MTTTLQRRGLAIGGTILLALALSIFTFTTARADPLAGTQGRGGVAFAAPQTPPAGTQGRGGVAFAASSTPLAGTDGRGGVALLPPTAAAVTSAAALAAGGAVTAARARAGALVARGRIPVPVASPPANAGWIAGGLAAAALIGGLIAFSVISRRDRRATETASVTSLGTEKVASSDGVSQEWERKAA